MQTLNLEWNSIGDDGARAVADGLQTLYLRSKNIGDDGARFVADVCKHCTKQSMDNSQPQHLEPSHDQQPLNDENPGHLSGLQGIPLYADV